MSDLYHGAILLWSERQAALLRRRAADAGAGGVMARIDRWNI